MQKRHICIRLRSTRAIQLKSHYDLYYKNVDRLENNNLSWKKKIHKKNRHMPDDNTIAGVETMTDFIAHLHSVFVVLCWWFCSNVILFLFFFASEYFLRCMNEWMPVLIQTRTLTNSRKLRWKEAKKKEREKKKQKWLLLLFFFI